jgi:hypothetical protein
MSARIRRYLIAAAGALLVCTFAFAQPKSDWEIKLEERDFKERELKLPEYPKEDNLIEFEASAATNFRFFVDSLSLSAAPDGVVRYTLVARSPSGAESISYNGLRCKTNAHRVYATARSDKTWSASGGGDWKELQPRTVTRQNLALARDFFCPAGVPIASNIEVVRALKRGSHPDAVSSHSNFTR